MIDEKKLIEERPEWLNPNCVGKEEYNKGWNACNKYWCNTIKRQPKVGEWILCSERLPEDLVAVNVTWINRCPENYYMQIKDKPFTDTAVLYQGKWYWWDSTIIDYLSECGICISGLVNKSIDILAWQPLPEPYKGE